MQGTAGEAKSDCAVWGAGMSTAHDREDSETCIAMIIVIGFMAGLVLRDGL